MRVRDLDLKRLSANLANAGFKPEIRLEKTIASFAEIAGLSNNGDIDAEVLASTFEILGMPCEGDDPIITKRRSTLDDLGKAMREQTGGEIVTHGFPFVWFESQIAAFANTEDDRHRAMAATAERELAELKLL